MKNLPACEIWYVTGSQHLYGEAVLKQVAANSQKIVQELNASGRLPLPLVFKPILTRPEEVRALCRRRTPRRDAPGSCCGCTRSHPPRCGSAD